MYTVLLKDAINIMLYISAPFGNYLHARNAKSVLGTYTVERRPGRIKAILQTLRYSFKDKAWYNALGLRNPGIKSLTFPLKSNQLLSISAIEPNDWRRLYEIIPPEIPLELNISCPNIKKEYHAYIQDIPRFVERNPIIKLGPLLTTGQIHDLYSMGFNKFHSCNALPTLNRGARSGDILKPHVIMQIEFIKDLNDTNYCIAGGGIQNLEDISYYESHGANAYSLGTVCFNPLKFRKIINNYGVES